MPMIRICFGLTALGALAVLTAMRYIRFCRSGRLIQRRVGDLSHQMFAVLTALSRGQAVAGQSFRFGPPLVDRSELRGRSRDAP